MATSLPSSGPDTQPIIARSSTDNRQALARKGLSIAAAGWWVVALIGQWIFVAYLLMAYARHALQGNLAAWNEASQNGIIAGDLIGNVSFVVHILLAVIVIGGGPLQLVPAIRAHYPRFHHWNGRVYIPSVMLTALVGLYLVWTREIPGGLIMTLGISLDAILVLVFAVLTIRLAMARKLVAHRRWALRLFLVVSGVWFFRIGLMFWFAATGGIGIDVETFSGPFMSIWSFGQYLLPLAILELYFRASDRAGPIGLWVMSGVLAAFTLIMGVGIFVATMGMWLPHF